MPGTFIAIPGLDCAALARPVAITDPRLTAGSVVLVDPGHPLTPWSLALSPAAIPNLAHTQAAAMLGSSAGTATLAITNTLSASTGSLEQTAKGGLHARIKQSGSVASEALSIVSSSEIATFITNHATDDWYTSLWLRMTKRNDPSVTVMLAGLGVSGSATATRLGFVQAGTGNITTQPSGSTLGRVIATLTDGVGLARVDLADDGFTTPQTGAVIRAGNFGGSGLQNKAPSWILYAYHLIHLPTAGMTYAEVSAIDQDQFAVAFGPNGRYADDSWTTPS